MTQRSAIQSSLQPRWIDGDDAAPFSGKAVCIGRNYVAHIEELNNPRPSEPLLFIKPATALRPLSEPIHLPDHGDDCHFETELTLLIGAPLSRATAEEAKKAVVGFGLALDLTLRDVQAVLKKKGLPWELAKGFDGACPVSRFVPASRIADPQVLRYTLQVNGETRQQGDPTKMLWEMFELTAHISRFFTLMPGDLILTGTPEGVSALVSGDHMQLTLHTVGGEILLEEQGRVV
ncbi:MAG: fumarylacetoacetate hydrolase family protein [Magnetococcales bacterium]|nr:fumarylacetoacetate hydrolase family protein [Magnetococcales bacterium]